MGIILLRHGKPDCNKKKWIGYSKFKEWIESYKCVNLDKNFVFSNSFELLSSTDKIVFSSDLPRSLQTAKELSPLYTVDSLFTEVDFSLPKVFLPIKLRPMMWMTLCRIIWVLGFHCQVESFKSTKKRAQQAAYYLIESTKKQVQVILVGHGFFNLFIAIELRKKGWHGPLIPNFRYSKGSAYRSKSVLSATTDDSEVVNVSDEIELNI